MQPSKPPLSRCRTADYLANSTRQLVISLRTTTAAGRCHGRCSISASQHGHREILLRSAGAHVTAARCFSSTRSPSLLRSHGLTVPAGTPRALQPLMEQLVEYHAETAPLPIHVQPFVVGTAPSGTSRCRSCGFAIAEDEIRIGVTSSSASGDFSVPSWHHLHCFETIHLPFYAACYYPSLPQQQQQNCATAVLPSPLLLPLPNPPVFDTSQTLTRDLALGAFELTAALRAITGNYGFALTAPQYKEVTFVAQRMRLARASVKSIPTTSAAARKLTKRKATPRPRGKAAAAAAAAASEASGVSPETYYMSGEALIAELELNYGKAAVRRYCKERLPDTLVGASARETRRLAICQSLVADGRAFGALASTCARCGGLLRASSRGGAECTGALDAFTACGNVLAPGEVRRKPWRLYRDASCTANNDGRQTVFLPMEERDRQLGGLASFPLRVYEGDYGQFQVPLLNLDTAAVLRPPPAAPRPVHLANLFHNVNLCLSPRDVRQLSRTWALTHPVGNSVQLAGGHVCAPEEVATAVDAAAAAVFGGGAGGAFDFFYPPYWGPQSEYVQPSRDPAGFFFPPYRWLGVARSATEAKAFMDRARAAVTVNASVSPTTLVGSGGKKHESARGRAQGGGRDAHADQLLSRIPFYRPPYLDLCHLLGHRPPHLDEPPYGDLYIANKPVLTAAQRARLDAYKARKQRVLASAANALAPASAAANTVAAATETEVSFQGKYPVDYLCPDAASYQVETHAGNPLIPYSVILTKTDLVKGNNSFYIMQLLRRRAGAGNSVAAEEYYVYRRWGRVGEEMKSGTSLSKPMRQAEARRMFDELFEEKTGNPRAVLSGRRAFRKKAGLFHFTPPESLSAMSRGITSAPSSPSTVASEAKGTASGVGGGGKQQSVRVLHPETRALLHDLFNPSGLEQQMFRMRIDLTKLPLGNLNAAALDEAAAVLLKLTAVVKRIDAAVEKQMTRHRKKRPAQQQQRRGQSVRKGANSSGEVGAGPPAGGGGAPVHPLRSAATSGNGAGDPTPATLSVVSVGSQAALTDAQLRAEVRHRLKLPSGLQRRLISLSNHFYSLVPHVMSDTSRSGAATAAHKNPGDRSVTGSLKMDSSLILDTMDKLSEKQQTVDDLRDVLSTRKLVDMSEAIAAKNAAADILWEHYNSLGADLTYLGPHGPLDTWPGKDKTHAAAVATAPGRKTRLGGSQGGAGLTAYEDNLWQDPALTFHRIVQYFNETQSSHHTKATVTGVWQVARRDAVEADRFAQFVMTNHDFITSAPATAAAASAAAGDSVTATKRPVKRMLLWHGSRLSNWVRICTQGLRITPPNVPTTGAMFGKGIYFADCSTKSCAYCDSSYHHSTPAGRSQRPSQGPSDRRSKPYETILALCEVAVGATPLVLYRDTSGQIPQLVQYFNSADGCVSAQVQRMLKGCKAKRQKNRKGAQALTSPTAPSLPRAENQYATFGVGDLTMAAEETLAHSGAVLPVGKALLLWDKYEANKDSVSPPKLREDIEEWVAAARHKHEEALAQHQSRVAAAVKRSAHRAPGGGAGKKNAVAAAAPQPPSLKQIFGDHTKLLHNEYIVYDAAQVRLRYLVTFERRPR